MKTKEEQLELFTDKERISLRGTPLSGVWNHVMRQVLDLGQSCLSEHQYRAFRKMVMDFFADGKRQMGWCGDDSRQIQSKGGGAHD